MKMEYKRPEKFCTNPEKHRVCYLGSTFKTCDECNAEHKRIFGGITAKDLAGIFDKKGVIENG